MLATKNLSFRYKGSKAIQFPDLQIEDNEALLICGESGCGKTTLLHLLAGLRRPAEGEIFIDGQELSALSNPKLDEFRGKQIGIVYQQSYFVQSINVMDNLLVSPFSETKTKALEVAKRLKIDHLLSRYPHQLSLGQQQRLSIARAVMNNPKLILADEPTSALDDSTCQEVIHLLKDEAKRNNAVIIIVTHDNRLKSEIENVVELQPLTAQI